MPSVQYKHYVLLLLTVVGVFNYLDRGVLALAMEPIKAEFELSDSQLGLMSGLAFAFFYAIAGVPIARWADRGHRKQVITLSAALCGGMLMLCSWAGSFAQLLIARVGVGVGESGCVPPAQSLISGYFNRSERPRAMAVYWLCGPISIIVSYLGGGWLIEQYGWRTTFMLIGIPGIILAIVVKFTLREPPLAQQNSKAVTQPPFKEVLSILCQGRALRYLVLAYCLSGFFLVGSAQWIPTFFIRSHGMEASQLGLWLGLGFGVGGLFFTYLGGHLATRYAPSKESVQMRWLAPLTVLCAGFYVLAFLTDNKILALVSVSIVGGGLVPMSSAPIYAAMQALVQDRMRAVALALIFMLSHLIGLGIGPLAVGFISDSLAQSYGQESLRYALILFSPGLLIGALLIWKAARTIEEDILIIESKHVSAQNQDSNAQTDNPHQSPDKTSTVI